MASSVPKIYDFDPRNLPAEMLQAIGLVAAAAAQTEAIVQDLIGGLLKIDEIEARALTAHMSAPLKDHVARALAELNSPNVQEIDTLDELLDEVNNAYTRRNLIVHNAFAIDSETGEVFSYRESARGSLQVSLQPIRVEQLQEDALIIYGIGMRVMDYMVARGIIPRERRVGRNLPFNRKAKARADRRKMSVGK